MKIAVSIVDHPLGRIVLGLFAAVVTALFGIFSFFLLISNPLQDPAAFATGLGAFLGLLGWWARVLVRPSALARRPRFRTALAGCLLVGTGAASYALLFTPSSTPAFPLLWAMVGAGVLLFLGTIAHSGPGPNNSSKPAPLRGAA